MLRSDVQQRIHVHWQSVNVHDQDRLQAADDVYRVADVLPFARNGISFHMPARNCDLRQDSRHHQLNQSMR